MVLADQIQIMRTEILGQEKANSNEQDTIFEITLNQAKHIALDRMYPFHQDETTLPERYHNWQVRAAIELYKRLGDEGIVRYSENGLSYTYAKDLISDSLLEELPPPKAGVIS